MTDKEQLEMALTFAEAAARMLNLPASNKLQMLKVIADNYSVPLTIDMLNDAPDDAPDEAAEQPHEGVESVSFSTTEMLRQRGKPMTPAEFSSKAVRAGYLQVKKGNQNFKTSKKYNVLTEKGLPFGKDVFSTKGETRVYWYVDTFTSLLKLIS